MALLEQLWIHQWDSEIVAILMLSPHQFSFIDDTDILDVQLAS